MTTVVPSSRVTHIADIEHRAEMSDGTSVPSNWRLASTGSNGGIVWSPESTGGASVSYGSNATDVSSAASGGGSETAVSRAGHVHKGVHRITGSGSNGLFGDIDIVGQGSVGVTINGQTIQISGPGSSAGGSTGSSALLDAIYGNGSDGDVTIAAGTTTLTRDMYYNNLTVTGTLATNGWRVFVKGTISGAGTISNNPTATGNGGNGTGAAGGAAGTAGGTTSANNLGRGAQGVAGKIGGFNAVGSAGTNGQPSTMARPDTNTVDHPASTAGGNGTSAGGAGVAANNGSNTGEPKPVYYPTCVTWRDPISGGGLDTNNFSGRASSGGSGGGGSGAGGGGSGASGAGGGPIVLAAKTWTGSFTIQSKGAAGGNGGNGFAGGAGAAGGGAGANGGPGGTVVGIYKDRSGWSGSIDVSGGAGGTHGNGGNGGTNGGDGATGPTGQKLEFQMG